MDKKKIQALVSLMSDDDREVREHVSQELMLLGEAVIPYLVEAVETAELDSVYQDRLINMVHLLQYDSLQAKLATWTLMGGENLLEGMAMVASYQYPEVTLEKLQPEIDRYYYDAWIRLRSDMHPYDQVRVLNEVLLQEANFSANGANFHSPGNSMINVVLESKKGNPISLCVVYLLVAQKLGLPIYGVNLPNIFILTYKSESIQFYINVFSKGIIFSRKDIDSFIKQLKLEKSDVFYEPCSHIDIVQRVLRNLMASFDHLGEAEKMAEVETLLNITKANNNGAQVS